MQTLASPHIWLDGRGTAWVDDTNTKVREIALGVIAHGWSPKEIHLQHPHLSLAQIHAAERVWLWGLGSSGERVPFFHQPLARALLAKSPRGAVHPDSRRFDSGHPHRRPRDSSTVRPMSLAICRSKKTRTGWRVRRAVAKTTDGATDGRAPTNGRVISRRFSSGINHC